MIIEDPEFGEIIIRKNSLSRNIRFSVHNSGRLQISAPLHASNFSIKTALKLHRDAIISKLNIGSPTTQKARDQKIQLLRREAANFLPYRLEYLAKLHGYRYERLRLSHPTTRWGSCSTTGTISLNIGLMNLPTELRDYVILHELAHLKHPDHSIAFWKEVEKHDPKYKYHRAALKNYSPAV